MPGYARLQLLPLLVGVAVLLQAIASTSAAATTPRPPDAETGDDCMPMIASKCFNEVATDLACQRRFWRANGTTCASRDAVDMCFTLDDALNCTSDIIDGDCSASDGRRTYDDWLRGLRSVQRHLCANNATTMRALIQPTSSWNPQRYLTCMEDSVRVHQPADFMRAVLNSNKCSEILTAGGRCSGRATVPTEPHVQWAPDSALELALDDALAAFLLETPCRSMCWQTAGQTGTTTVMPGGAMAAIVLLAILALVLLTVQGVVAYRTACFRVPMPR